MFANLFILWLLGSLALAVVVGHAIAAMGQDQEHLQ